MRRNKRSKKYAAPASNKHPILWMLTGVLIGLFICSLTLLKKKSVGEPAPVEQSKTISAPIVKKINSNHKEKTQDTKKSHTDPSEQYDFYTMLPKMQSNQQEAPSAPAVIKPTKPLAVAEQSMLSPSAKPLEVAAPTPTAPVVQSPAPTLQATDQSKEIPAQITPPATTVKKYTVIAGDFAAYADADAKKAELVLAGITGATIEPYLSNDATHYRINLGSYPNKTAATEILDQLQSAQLSGSIIEPS